MSRAKSQPRDAPRSQRIWNASPIRNSSTSALTMSLNTKALAAVTSGVPGGRRVKVSAEPVIMWISSVDE